MNKKILLLLLILMPLMASAQTKRTIHVEKAGTLSTLIPEEEKYLIEELKLTGEINGTDICLIRDMAGVIGEFDTDIQDTEGKLQYLDLSEINIVSGGWAFESIIGPNTDWVTENNKLTGYMFFGCNKLKTVVLPLSVNTIMDFCFYGTMVTSVTIPSNVQIINPSAFIYCKMTYVIIGSGVLKIKKNAFSHCSELTDIYCLQENISTYQTANHMYTDLSAFDGTNIENITLHVPATSVDNYKAIEPWKNFKEVVAIDGDVPSIPKCAIPTISFVDGKLHFDCETEGVTYKYNISAPNTSGEGNDISLSTITITAYAKKDNYESSNVIRTEIPVSSILGDLNNDGKVDVSDHVKLSSIIMDQNK